MPKFSRLTVEKALLKTKSDTRQKVLADYIRFINGLTVGDAVKVVASDGESLSTIRRRLGDAMRLSGQKIEIKRGDDGIYFWLQAETQKRKRRPRSSKN